MPAPAKILGPNGQPYAVQRVKAPPLRSRYDAAEINQENTRLWEPADGLSARSANSPEVRRRLRNRARYEVDANNSYAWGIVQTLANDTIGTGPRLQLLTEDKETNKRVGEAFEAWTAETCLAEKLRTMRQAKAVDGEAFGLFVTNPRLRTEVQLDIRLIEADQVATPYMDFLDPRSVDGIKFDRFGNPTEYHVLESHPGDELSFNLTSEYDRVPARLVLHWFRVIRPGQVRGIPDITPALPLFALLRRYTLAVLAAAETAADFAAVLYSELPPDGEQIEGEPFETLEIERRLMTTLPAGWKMGQFRAEQPTTTYGMFKAEILNEIARCLNMPYNVAAGNSSGYNYASGRLDHQTYFKSIGVDQYHLETAILDRVFFAWLEEAYMVGLVDQPPDRLSGWKHVWHWDGYEHVDPVKEANAEAIRLENGTTTYADVWAAQGHDYESKLRQWVTEKSMIEKLRKELGLQPSPTEAPPQPTRQPAQQPAQDDGEDDDAED